MRIIGLLLKVYLFVASLLVCLSFRVTLRDYLQQRGEILDWTQQLLLVGIAGTYFGLLLVWMMRPFLRKN